MEEQYENKTRLFLQESDSKKKFLDEETHKVEERRKQIEDENQRIEQRMRQIEEQSQIFEQHRQKMEEEFERKRKLIEEESLKIEQLRRDVKTMKEEQEPKVIEESVEEEQVEPVVEEPVEEDLLEEQEDIDYEQPPEKMDEKNCYRFANNFVIKIKKKHDSELRYTKADLISYKKDDIANICRNFHISKINDRYMAGCGISQQMLAILYVQNLK